MAESELLKKAFEIMDYIVSAKRRIHREPELGMKEFKTAAFVRSELERMGIGILPLDTDVGVVAVISGTKPGKGCVSALRADMDALPIQEELDIVDRSIVPGVMHACGHDCHTAMLLGAASLLQGMRDRFSGTVKLIFQPAEETLGGSEHMIRLGALASPDVEFILGIHGHGILEVGEIGFRSGQYMASSDFFTVIMHGMSGHGAYPHRVACDPILAASNAVIAIQSIITRQIDALDNVVISVCQISGGTAKNIIPEKVEFGGSVRCQNPQTRNSIEGRIRKVAEASAQMYNCSAELDYHYGVPPLVNSPELTTLARKSAEILVGADRVKEIAIPAMGSEDFSRYGEVVPHSLFARLGIREPGKAETKFHNGCFLFPEEALPYGTAFMTQFVLDVNV